MHDYTIRIHRALPRGLESTLVVYLGHLQALDAPAGMLEAFRLTRISTTTNTFLKITLLSSSSIHGTYQFFYQSVLLL